MRGKYARGRGHGSWFIAYWRPTLKYQRGQKLKWFIIFKVFIFYHSSFQGIFYLITVWENIEFCQIMFNLVRVREKHQPVLKRPLTQSDIIIRKCGCFLEKVRRNSNKEKFLKWNVMFTASNFSWLCFQVNAHVENVLIYVH